MRRYAHVRTDAGDKLKPPPVSGVDDYLQAVRRRRTDGADRNLLKTRPGSGNSRVTWKPCAVLSGNGPEMAGSFEAYVRKTSRTSSPYRCWYGEFAMSESTLFRQLKTPRRASPIPVSARGRCASLHAANCWKTALTIPLPEWLPSGLYRSRLSPELQKRFGKLPSIILVS